MPLSMDKLGKMIEQIAPPHLAESWDNTGFNVHLHQNEVTGVLVCLDVSEAVIEEAAEKGYNMILSHHPLLFEGLKIVDNTTYAGGCIAKLLKHGISLYCAHTSMDSAEGGINTWLADLFGLEDRRSLLPSGSAYYKVAVTVPSQNAESVRAAMGQAGAGALGNYTNCTYRVKGEGTFQPGAGATPFIGSKGVLERVEEEWIQALCAAEKLSEVLDAIRKTHPYEEPAIDVFELKNVDYDNTGLGVVGKLPLPMTAREVLNALKKGIETDSVRFCGELDRKIERIAVCGGGGSQLIPAAQKMGAQLYITGELKHHNYLEQGMALVEAGHFDTEKCFCELFANGLQKALDAVEYSAVPVTVSELLERPYINY